MDTLDGIGLDILEDLDELIDLNIIDFLMNIIQELYNENNINIGDTLHQRNIFHNLN